MKKILSLILALALLCTATFALAEGVTDAAAVEAAENGPATLHAVPHKDTFAGMKIKTKGGWTYITLSKPVDKLFVSWPSDLKLVELAVNDKLEATVLLNGNEYQAGVQYNEDAPLKYYACSDELSFEMGTSSDRAFITVQGNWIVSYNRKGEIVDIDYTKAGDVEDIVNAAFGI